MTRDITELNSFYNTPLGSKAADSILEIIKDIWPDLKGTIVLGIGYPLPYFNELTKSTDRQLVFMPAAQGISHWPDPEHNVSALIDEDSLPLADESIDRIIVIHALEHTQAVPVFLRELWRILKSDGRIIFITPNRRGLWARFDNTPFGHGNPYTTSQLSQLLRDNLFTPLTSRCGLYLLPSYLRLALSLSKISDYFPQQFKSRFSGIIALEATKHVYSIYPARGKRVSIAVKVVGSV